MKLNPNTSFLAACVAGFAGMGFGFLTQSYAKFLGPAFCILILLVYHRYAYTAILSDALRKLPDGRVVTQTAMADACYYLGFIFTLLILLTAFISSTDVTPETTKQEVNISLVPVLTQFAAGLFTTGYGLAARIHLNMLTDTEEMDPDQLRQRLTLRTLELIAVIENGMKQVASAVTRANKSIVDGAQSVDEQINTRANALTQELDKVTAKLRAELRAISFETEITKIKTSLGGLAEQLLSANTTTATISRAIERSAKMQDEKVTQIVETLEKLSSGANATVIAVESLHAKFRDADQALQKYTTSLGNSSASTIKLTETSEAFGLRLSALSSGSEALRGSFGKTAEASGNLSSESLALVQRLREVEGPLQRLGVEVDSLTSAVGETISRLKSDLGSVTDVLTRNATAALSFEQNVGAAGRAGGQLTGALEAIGLRANNLGQQLAALEQRLVAIDKGFQQTIIELAETSRRLRAVAVPPTS